MSHRVERFSSTLKQCIADILVNELNDPSIQGISISDVVVTKDLKKARIFISSPFNNADAAVAHLTKAKGNIKRALDKRMYLRFVPELIFIKDVTYSLHWETTSESPPQQDH